MGIKKWNGIGGELALLVNVEQGFEQSAGLSARYLSPDSKLFHKEFPL